MNATLTRPSVKSARVLFSALQPHPAPRSFGRGILPAPAPAPFIPDHRDWPTAEEVSRRLEETTYSKAERDLAMLLEVPFAEARERLELLRDLGRESAELTIDAINQGRAWDEIEEEMDERAAELAWLTSLPTDAECADANTTFANVLATAEPPAAPVKARKPRPMTQHQRSKLARLAGR